MRRSLLLALLAFPLAATPAFAQEEEEESSEEEEEELEEELQALLGQEVLL